MRKFDYQNLSRQVGIDKLDLQIISMLLKNAKTPHGEIGKKLKVSGSTVHFRIKKLEELKAINRFTLNIDFSKLGLNVIAYIGFIIDGKLHNEIVEKLKKIKEIVELHHTTGKYHMFAKIVCMNTKELKEVLITKVNSIQGVEKTETTISLEEIINSSANLLK